VNKLISTPISNYPSPLSSFSYRKLKRSPSVEWEAYRKIRHRRSHKTTIRIAGPSSQPKWKLRWASFSAKVRRSSQQLSSLLNNLSVKEPHEKSPSRQVKCFTASYARNLIQENAMSARLYIVLRRFISGTSPSVNAPPARKLTPPTRH
jgi:hypothetical protein